MRYFKPRLKNVFLSFFLSSLTCSQKANFRVYPVLSMDNKVSSVLCLNGKRRRRRGHIKVVT